MTLINDREKKKKDASEIEILDQLNPEEGFRIRAVNVDLFDLRLREMEFGINVAKRIVFLDGGIEPATLFRLKQQLDTILDTCNEEDPISIYINTYGGDAHAMFGIIDLIKTYPVKINTTAMGAAMSAGAWILMSGTGIRAITKGSIIMFHEVQSSHHGPSTKIESTVEHSRLLQDMTSELIYDRTNISKKAWIEMLKDKQEIFFNADECLKYDIVDKIL
jgi:ATP-dependent Clp protease protease subunit